jgi:TonB family protein
MSIKNIMHGFLLVALSVPTLVTPTLVLAKENHLVRLQRMIDEHTVVVQQKVVSGWTLPSVPMAKLSSVVEVTVTMSGEVAATRVTNSSGNLDFDRSAEVAVTRSSPLPVATDPEVMDQFRTLTFEFRSGGSETTVDVPVANENLGYVNYVRVKSPIYIDK